MGWILYSFKGAPFLPNKLAQVFTRIVGSVEARPTEANLTGQFWMVNGYLKIQSIDFFNLFLNLFVSQKVIFFLVLSKIWRTPKRRKSTYSLIIKIKKKIKKFLRWNYTLWFSKIFIAQRKINSYCHILEIGLLILFGLTP